MNDSAGGQRKQPGLGPGGRGAKPPLDFTYRCANCTLRLPLTLGDPKAGLCGQCSIMVSPETRALIGVRVLLDVKH